MAMGSAAVAAVINSRFRRAREVKRFILQVRLGLFQPVKSEAANAKAIKCRRRGCDPTEEWQASLRNCGEILDWDRG
jgi:hypothetical protein